MCSDFECECVLTLSVCSDFECVLTLSVCSDFECVF